MSNTVPVLRFARPTKDLHRILHFYHKALGLQVIASFDDHEGFDGRILAPATGAPWHLEFTYEHPSETDAEKKEESVAPPTDDNLLVLYLPNKADYDARKRKMEEYGYANVKAINPYWDRHGVTFCDPEGWRVVLANMEWTV